MLTGPQPRLPRTMTAQFENCDVSSASAIVFIHLLEMTDCIFQHVFLNIISISTINAAEM